MFSLKKAFSLIESLVALFVLSMITLVYINSSTVFFKQSDWFSKSWSTWSTGGFNNPRHNGIC